MKRWLGSLSPRRILFVLLVSAAAIALAVSAAFSALENAMRTRNPALVDRLTDDPIAPLLIVEQQLETSPSRLMDQEVGRIARDALKSEAINPLALRTLALQAGALGNPGAAATFAALSERVSRRDLLTQILLIEGAVQANDHLLALKHYDKALRTSSEAKGILFPILSAAISDAEIREALVPYVRARAVWMPFFIQSAMWSSERGPRETALLLTAAGTAGDSDLMKANFTTLLGLLVDRGEFELAKRLFFQMPGSSQQMLTDVTFSAKTTNPKFGPLVWNALNGASAAAYFEGSADQSRRTARVVANSGERGIVLRRVVGLRPGQYYLSEARSPVFVDGTSRAFWEMKCPSTGGELRTIWRGPADRAIYDVSRALGPRIPVDCATQLLTLNFIAGESQQGLEFVIEEFKLTQ